MQVLQFYSGSRQSYSPDCSLVNTWTTAGRWPGTSVYTVLWIAWLRPQSPRRLAWQLSVPVSQTVRSSSVTRLQLLHKQTNTGTCTTQTAETHWSTRRRFLEIPWLVTPGYWLPNVICTWSWRLGGINGAIPVTLLHSPCGMPAHIMTSVVVVIVFLAVWAERGTAVPLCVV
jgi:hypothetical protein